MKLYYNTIIQYTHGYMYLRLQYLIIFQVIVVFVFFSNILFLINASASSRSDVIVKAGVARTTVIEFLPSNQLHLISLKTSVNEQCLEILYSIFLMKLKKNIGMNQTIFNNNQN